MIKAISNFFERLTKVEESPQAADEALAIAALLIEVATSDNEFAQTEHETLLFLLEREFGCNKAETEALLQRAKTSHQDSISLHRYTSVVKQATMDVRRGVIRGLWRIAYADGHIDPHEEATIRKVADLLYVSHSDFIKAKITTQMALEL